jgi:hypothetical protein
MLWLNNGQWRLLGSGKTGCRELTFCPSDAEWMGKQ